MCIRDRQATDPSRANTISLLRSSSLRKPPARIMRATESAKLENARNFSRLFNESKYRFEFGKRVTGVMNDTVATEGQEQPATCHERKARALDRDPGSRTSSRPADICSAQTGRPSDRSR